MSKYHLRSEDTVLLVIDLQEKLMNAMESRNRVYHNTILLLEAAKQLSIPVLVTEQYPRGLGRTVPEISSSLPEHTLIEKNCFSACTDELNQTLKDIGKRSLVITGSETHICVFQTTRDLLEQGYEVHVANDAVCSRTEDNYRSGLDLMKSAGAVITNTETVIFDLLKVSGTPAFKHMSALLK